MTMANGVKAASQTLGKATAAPSGDNSTSTATKDTSTDVPRARHRPRRQHHKTDVGAGAATSTSKQPPPAMTSNERSTASQPPAHQPHSMVTRSQTKASSNSGLNGGRGYVPEPKLFLLPQPEPTPEYLDQVDLGSTKTAKPQDLLIVLDVNGTLARKVGKKTAKPRPFVAQFLAYAQKNFSIVIWSSSQPDTLVRRCKELFTDVGLPIPSMVWNRTHFHLTKKLYERNVQVYKRLTWVWESEELAKAYPGKDFDASNTILIDDSELKASSEPYNLLRIAEFGTDEQQANEFGRVIRYLELARYQSNVCAFIKARPYHSEVYSEEAFDWDGLAAEDLADLTGKLRLADAVETT